MLIRRVPQVVYCGGMAKRQLTRRQAWRIKKIQDERLARAQKRETRVVVGPDLGPEQQGLVIANYGAALDVEREDGTVHRCVTRSNLEPIVVGDSVVWQEGTDGLGVVSAVVPRHSLLARPTDAGSKPIAANIDQILVVSAPAPAYSLNLIDQYLIAAEHTGIRPILLFNKTDLLDGERRRRIESDLQIYSGLGYAALYVSTRAAHGLDDLVAVLRGKTSVFVGQSGVGKSSLIKALMPGLDIRVGELSGELGQHTTSAARLYHLPEGGSLIDSPGVREFGLWPMNPRELAEGFVEFRPRLGHCRFRDCTHRHEPDCAVRKAVESGGITRARYESFLRLVESLDSGNRQF